VLPIPGPPVGPHLLRLLGKAFLPLDPSRVSGRDDLDRLGLKILHLLHHEYSPTDTLTLPTVFNKWSTLHQHKTETALAFTGRVRTLAQQSWRCRQTYTEPSIILTFLCGLNSSFEDFVQDHHTGHNDVTTAS
jgi:hypothetical protein